MPDTSRSGRINTRRRVVSLLMLLFVVFVAPAIRLSAQDVEESLPTSTYDMYYPKRASGAQPTAWDPGEVDDINVYNGNLMLTFPLGPPLEGGADVSWQPTLYYNSKIWANDRRDRRLDGSDTPSCSTTIEGRGFVLGDPWLGLGWTLGAPHIYIRRFQPADCYALSCMEFSVEALVTADGARHPLVPCTLEGGCGEDGGPQVWYSNDGSGWKVTWIDGGSTGVIDEGDVFEGSRDGLRYTFSHPYLMGNADPYSGGPGSDISRGRPTDTDFLSDARGFYLTRIESVRWATPPDGDGNTFPAIEFSYIDQGDGKTRRELETVTARGSDGTTTKTLEFVYDSDGSNPLCTSSPSLPDPFDDDWGDDWPPPPPHGGRLCGVVSWSGGAGSGTALTAYRFSRSISNDIQILKFPDYSDFPACRDADCTDLPPYSIANVPLLVGLDRLEPDGSNPPGWSVTPLSWSFTYRSGDGQVDCKNLPPSRRVDLEDQGVLTRMDLPNGAWVEYLYGLWTFTHHKLTGTNCIVRDVEAAVTGAAPAIDDEGRELCVDVATESDPTVGVVDRRFVAPAAGGGDPILLEWTEYFSGLDDNPDNYAGAIWYLAAEYNGEARLSTVPVDLDGSELASGAGSHLDRLYLGYDQRVVRKHMIVGKAGDPSDDIPAGYQAGLGLDYRRYDDTLIVFSNGEVVYDSNGDERIDPGDTYGKLAIAGRPFMTRRYRGTAGSGGEGETFYWFLDDHPAPLEVETVTYTSQSTHDPSIPDWKRTHFLLPDLGGSDGRAWSGNTRSRRRVTAHPGGNYEGSLTTYLAQEYLYETDGDNPGGLGEGVPSYPWNRVKTVTLEDFVESPPGPSSGWGALGVPFRTTTTAFVKDPGLLDLWLTSLPAETIQETTADGGETPQFTRVSRAYDEDLGPCQGHSGLLTTERHHSERTGNSDADVLRSLTYNCGPDSPGSFGKIRTVKLRKAENGARTDLLTGYLWDHQRLKEKWILCDWDAEGTGVCPQWSASGAFDNLPGENQGSVDIDPAWWRTVAVRDANGHGIALIEYDALGRTTQIVPTSSERAATTIQYPDLSTAEILVENSRGGEDLVGYYEYDALGRLAHMAHRKEGTTGSTYNEADFRHKTFSYDGVGNVWAESHWLTSLSFASNPGWDSNFEVKSAVDPFGRVLRAYSSTNYLAQHFYHYRGRQWSDSQEQVYSSDEKWVLKRVDGLGRLREVYEVKELPIGVGQPGSDDYYFDDERSILSVYEYSIRNEVTGVRITVPSGLGNPASGQKRTLVYDALGNLVKESIPERDGPVEFGAFSAQGIPRSTMLPVMDPAGGEIVVLEQELDPAGRTVRETVRQGMEEPDVTLRSMSYGTVAPEIGKLVEARQYNLSAQSCGEGDRGPADSIVVTSGYEHNGAQGELTRRRLSVSDTRYHYDDGFPAGGHSFEWSYGYDLWGNLSEITYPHEADPTRWEVPSPPEGMSVLPAAPVIGLTWDPMGLLAISGDMNGDPNRLLVGNVRYDAATGLMNQWSTPAGSSAGTVIETLHEVTPWGTRPLPSRIEATVAETEEVFNVRYTFDYLEKIRAEITPDGGYCTYSHDLIPRLERASCPQGSRSYVYDDFGNLTVLGERNITVDPATNRLAGTGVTAPMYDGLGNLLRRYEDGRARWVRRDAEGRVLEAWSEGVVERYRFAYDHNGERVATFTDKGLNTDTVLYTLRDESGNVLSDLQWSEGGSWSRMADRIYLGRDEQVRVVYDEGGVPTYITSVRDHLGTLRAEVYGSDSWTRIDLWPYGEIRRKALHNTTNDLTNGVHLFTGHERDWVGTATDPRKGLDYMHARYYTFELGRFMSVDPVGGTVGSSQSWNRYAYVRGNPVNAVDPDGEAGKEVADWIDRKVAAVAGFVDANTGGGTGAILLNAAVGTVGDMVSGAADMLRVGDSTGEAIGEGKNGEDLVLAVSQDVGRASALALTMAVPARSPIKARASRVRVNRAVKAVKEFVGEDASAFRNEAGDLVVESKDGLRQFRIDSKRPDPHSDPHAHVIRFKNAKNKKKIIENIRIFPAAKE